MGESLTQRRRVGDEGLRVVKPCELGGSLSRLIPWCGDIPTEEAPANYVPAAAVKRRGQALFGITGRKARVGGLFSRK